MSDEKPRIIIAGAPASGKGTQCEMIVEKFGVVHISTGDALRAQVKAETELGLKAKEFMESGALVPDDLIIGIVKARLAETDCQEKGWLLDGFPRTGAQAEALIAEGIHATHFVLLEVPDEILVERCVGRRSDPETGKIYHLKFNPPPEDDAELMARLVHRADDTEEAMGKRIETYHENVKAVTPFYTGVMQTFDGQDDKTAIADKVADFLSTSAPAAPSEPAATSEPAPVAKSVPKVVIVGGPVSGKATQARMLKEKLGIVHLKSAEVQRQCVDQHTPMGEKVRQHMSSGLLMPDALLVEVFLERIAQPDCAEQGWVLDGFPKTAAQAELLVAAGVVPSLVVVMDVPEAHLVERGVGRRFDPDTGAVYHLRFSPPPNDPALLERLEQRTDDTEASMTKRVRAYRDNQAGIAATFPRPFMVDGTRPRDEIAAELAAEVAGQPLPRRAPGPRVIVAGPPAAGKGTVCAQLAQRHGMVHVSTGDELRRHIAAGSPIGKAAQAFVDAGELVPDEVMVGVVKARLVHQDCKQRGWLLDGFPRTGAQARALKAAGIEPDRFVIIDLNRQASLDRWEGRRVDPVTEEVYHLAFRPPPAEAAGRVVRRSDDSRAAVEAQLASYEQHAGGVLQYYACVARRVDGMRASGEVVAEVERFIAGEVPPDLSGRPARKPLLSPDEARAYIAKHLQPTLIKALAAVASEKPKDPVRALATTLLANNPNRPAVALPAVVLAAEPPLELAPPEESPGKFGRDATQAEK